MHPDVLVMILAGGEGSRLQPLTRERAKPAVPFGGRYRMIDFVLSNFVNSGFYRINVLTQYKSDSLSRHIHQGWHMSTQAGHYIEVVPAQQRKGEHWYLGSADAIFQNLNLIEDAAPEHVCVFGADHIYKMDVSQVIDFHKRRDSDLTIAAIPVPIEQAHQFGVMTVDEAGRVIRFDEKPSSPNPMPNDASRCLVSMGNYVFRTSTLEREVTRDAALAASAHDFGKSILAPMVDGGHGAVYVYDFSRNRIPAQPDDERGYWRDVGTIDAYWMASMDLVAIKPQFDLYNRSWPIRTFYDHFPPAKFVHDDPSGGRVGTAINSLVAEGCIVSGGSIRNSVLFPQVRVNSYSVVEDSVLFERVSVGRHARVRRAIIDKGVTIPPGATIGYDRERDLARFTVSPEGVIVVPKGARFEV